MKRLLSALLLAAAGCAHGASGTSAHLAAKAHGPLTLVEPTGLTDEQEPVLEDAICQAMVEQNHGDVACPSSNRAVLALARTKALTNGDEQSGEATLKDIQQATPQVTAAVARDGQKWVLTLQFLDKPGAAPSATRTLTAGSFEELVQDTPAATHALLE